MEQNKFYHNLSICKAESKSTFDSKVETVMAKACYDYMDVVLADFGEIQNDCLIHKVRPAIVISSTGYNTNSPVMQVIPMT
ncbi:MAG: type II toxin-antitoxin system PemK/MazF family toxin, partial [Clostridiales bacterium]|nr:type II toxin-antitoxin system PemK/MazF family toxin [Clostridiales bacterium]